MTFKVGEFYEETSTGSIAKCIKATSKVVEFEFDYNRTLETTPEEAANAFEETDEKW